MILDAGICKVYELRNIAPLGAKPIMGETEIYQSWYGLLSFETAPANPTGYREEIQADLKIRIHQNISVSNKCVISVKGEKFEVLRAYHGTDEDSGNLISDLTLGRLEV